MSPWKSDHSKKKEKTVVCSVKLTLSRTDWYIICVGEVKNLALRAREKKLEIFFLSSTFSRLSYNGTLWDDCLVFLSPLASPSQKCKSVCFQTNTGRTIRNLSERKKRVISVKFVNVWAWEGFKDKSGRYFSLEHDHYEIRNPAKIDRSLVLTIKLPLKPKALWPV